MKKTALLAALIAASAVGTSFAGTTKTNVVTIAGSTAFQTAAVAGLEALYNNGTNGWGLAARSGDGSSSAADTYRLYTNVSVSGTTTNKNFIAIHWTGSEGGLQAVANQKNVTVSQFPLSYTGTSSNMTVETLQLPVNIAFSDILQANSHFIGKGYAAFQDSQTYDVLGAAQKVGVLGFQWYASSNFPTGQYTLVSSNTNSGVVSTNTGYNVSNAVDSNSVVVSYTTNFTVAPNITKEIEQELQLNGSVPLARFTGRTNDLGTPVYCIGRNPDSGTRTSALLAAGLPATAQVTHYAVSSTGVVSLYPADNVNGLTIPAGQSGYASTGGVQGAIKNANLSGAIAVGCMGAGKTTTGVIGLTQEGTTLNAANVETGANPFWTYEELYQPKVALTGLGASVFSAISGWYQTTGNFSSQSSASYLHLQDMLVHRTGDQTPISSGAISH